MLDAFKIGVSTGRKQWRIAGIVYLFQFSLALTLGLQVLSVFESSIGNSLEINQLLAHYDFTVMADFLKTHGASITPLIGELRWLLLLYVIFAVFIDAGLLAVASKPNDATTKDFWQGGAQHFYPFMKIALFFFLLAALWSLLVFLPIALSLQAALEYFPNEKYVVFGLFFAVLVYLLGLSGLFLWSVCSRFYKIQTGASIRASLKNGWQILQKNKGKYWRLLGLFFTIQMILLLLYWQIDSFFGMTSALSILGMALLQQVFSLVRVLLRQMFYASIMHL